MKQVQMTQGFVALVDDEDYDLVSKHGWCPIKKKNGRAYALANIKVNGSWKRIPMHRFLLGAPAGSHVDHKDNNGLNNQRSNLRLATASQTQHNSGSRGGRSRFKGVSWSKAAGKWIAQICANNQRRYLGLFMEEEEAALAYDSAAQELHGEFAKLNFSSR